MTGARRPEEPDLKELAVINASNILAHVAILGKDRAVALAAAEVALTEYVSQI